MGQYQKTNYKSIKGIKCNKLFIYSVKRLKDFKYINKDAVQRTYTNLYNDVIKYKKNK